MFKFDDPTGFYFLLLIPILVIIYIWSAKKLLSRKISFGQIDMVSKLGANSRRNSLTSFAMIVFIILFLVLAWINPQWGMKKDKVKAEKSDIFIALDISSSMDATDISPSRLEKAKRLVESLIESRKGDQIGLILFAGGAYLQMPLSSDYAAAELFTKSANTSMAGTQGTAIGEAIELARKSVKSTEKAQKALVIITDGEDHDEDALGQVKEAVDEGWSVFTIGVGTPEGGFVPVMVDGREQFKTDDQGNPVKTTLNINLLKELADAGNGTSFIIDTDADIVNDINVQFEKLEKRAVEIQSFTEFRSYYQYFLALGMILISLNYFMFQTSNVRENE